VVLRGHAGRLQFVPLVNVADVPARKAECPDEEAKDDTTTVLNRPALLLLK